jgi:hypothetical protein
VLGILHPGICLEILHKDRFAREETRVLVFDNDGALAEILSAEPEAGYTKELIFPVIIEHDAAALYVKGRADALHKMVHKKIEILVG